jgi:uncharacterized protein
MAPTTQTTFPFPFDLGTERRFTATRGNDAIRAKIIQILFTAPGERVNKPDFGCGLLNLVFEPNNVVLEAAMEFTVARALSRWLKDDIVVEGVKVTSENETALVEVVYTTKQDLTRHAVRIRFH